jgi:signal peptidase I
LCSTTARRIFAGFTSTARRGGEGAHPGSLRGRLQRESQIVAKPPSRPGKPGKPPLPGGASAADPAADADRTLILPATGAPAERKAELKGALRSKGALRAREKARSKAAPAGPVDPGGVAWEWFKSIGAAVLLFLVIRTFLITAYSIPSESMEKTLLVGDYLMANNALFGATLPFTHVKLPALRDPHRGEIVVFRPTYNEPQIDVVKRVIGIPGDTLQMVDKVLFRNGQRAVEPFAHYDQGTDQPIEMEGFGIMDPNIRPEAFGAKNHLPILHPSVDARQYHPSRNNWGPVVVPAGHYWLMGDNRDQSLDSRFMGPIPRKVIRGKPLFIYYSYDKKDIDAAFPRFVTAARWGRIGHPIH